MVPLSIAVVLALVVGIGFLTPWPAAMLIRGAFQQGARDTVAEASKYVPADVDARIDLSYSTAGGDQLFDLFTPKGSTGPLPAVVWIHGGAWISGSKADVEPYARILASHGYAVVTLNYSISPEVVYPVAIQQLNSALGYLTAHAAELSIDPDRIVIAGDSAGANLTSQLAAVVTNPAYAELLGIEPALAPEQLAGVVLDCGIYDVSGIPEAPGLGGWGFRIALWAYIGAHDWISQPGGQEMSTIDYVTADFPATWISGGNGDPLTKGQSIPLAEKLDDLGVPVTALFYAEDHEPSLPHEYQFHLDFADAQNALASTVDFLDDVTRR
ncbi:MAG: alpha/beta hydrolase [Microbacteriaceae bacterium]|nr:alpha/beta hydrolase [Microbacteriaceae bacterium]